MKPHPQLGAQILEPVPRWPARPSWSIACHEHWDGSGYPQRAGRRPRSRWARA